MPTPTACRQCQKPVTGYRMRYFCSPACRNEWNSIKVIASGYSRDYQRKASGLKALPHPDKLPCLICGKHYKKPASHVAQAHGMNEREYKQLIDAPLSEGLITPKARAHLSALATAWGMPSQLEHAGKRTRFTPNDPRTKDGTNKGRKAFGFRAPKSDERTATVARRIPITKPQPLPDESRPSRWDFSNSNFLPISPASSSLIDPTPPFEAINLSHASTSIM